MNICSALFFSFSESADKPIMSSIHAPTCDVRAIKNKKIFRDGTILVNMIWSDYLDYSGATRNQFLHALF